ncbi:hypothetical protein [Mycobacterium antarcticum]|uniref:hypothetical protein n=1 Tax=Mycolicibacterium sp. TUM20983 TaxID=3023369 RepID=UPI0024E06D66|nr:hypothetical protein [Mycolicibacterium sp. TUM20983]
MTVANPYDVDARLAEGRPAIDDVEEYIAACRRLGYQHRDLTMHVAQVRDWYGSEEGMDLHALEADHATLSVAASAAEEAARCHADLASALSSAWSGGGSAAAHQFFWRTGEAASAVSAAVRTAADGAATLRDALWRAVDARVVATETVEDRSAAQRAEWLTAAKTVTTGVGDLAAASELIELQVKPFVDVEVGSNWLAAMRTAVASINAAYDAALADLASAPRATFGVPGDIGPRPAGYVRATDAQGTAMAPVHTVPAAAAPPALAAAAVPAPAAMTPAAASSGPAPAAAVPLAEPAPSVPASLPVAPAMPSVPSTGDLGAGASSLGSGISGFGQQLADLIGSLVGSTDEKLPGADELTDPTDAEDEPAADEPADDGEPVDPTEDDEAKPADEPEEPSEETVNTPAPEPLPPAEPVSTPVPAPAEVAPAPVVDPPLEAEEPTPCEIAADELPQVGE